ncbi:MAG TPA: IS1595 family transposase [Desulfotomaculum sp.]|nr:IS1595 family transposase [Desulfotomaculum sp.]HBY04780.1 IS1595 family transposase [Desulfotomaculum sp.]
MAKQEPISLLEFQSRFRDEEACREHLFSLRWPEGFYCPRCGNKTAYLIKTRHLYECTSCSYQVSVTAGTVMHKTRTSLVAWFWAIYLIAHDKRGSSSLSLKKSLGVSYQTAWAISHKIRKAMTDRDSQYKLAGLVKMDDAYFGGAGEGGDKSGRGTEKTPVIVAVSVEKNDHPCHVKMEVVESLNRKAADEFVHKHVTPGSKVTTDGLNIYAELDKVGYQHERIIINKNKKQGLETFKWIHTIISNAKAFIAGTFHGLDNRHLQSYLNEFCYRFNRRFWEPELFNRLLKACVAAKPVAFSELTG